MSHHQQQPPDFKTVKNQQPSNKPACRPSWPRVLSVHRERNSFCWLRCARAEDRIERWTGRCKRTTTSSSRKRAFPRSCSDSWLPLLRTCHRTVSGAEPWQSIYAIITFSICSNFFDRFLFSVSTSLYRMSEIKFGYSRLVRLQSRE